MITDNFSIVKALATIPPAVPTVLTATAVSATQIDLTWTNNTTDERGYEIEWSTDGGVTFSPLITRAANTTVYQDTGLAAGFTYCYQVRAVNGAGSSEFTNVDCATTLAVPVL